MNEAYINFSVRRKKIQQSLKMHSRKCNFRKASLNPLTCFEKSNYHQRLAIRYAAKFLIGLEHKLHNLIGCKTSATYLGASRW